MDFDGRIEWRNLDWEQDQNQIHIHVLENGVDVIATVVAEQVMARAQAGPVARIGRECYSLLAPIWSNLERPPGQHIVRG